MNKKLSINKKTFLTYFPSVAYTWKNVIGEGVYRPPSCRSYQGGGIEPPPPHVEYMLNSRES